MSKNLSNAINLYSSKNYNGAISIFEEIIKNINIENEKNISLDFLLLLYRNTAYTYIDISDFDGSIKYFEKTYFYTEKILNNIGGFNNNFGKDNLIGCLSSYIYALSMVKVFDIEQRKIYERNLFTYFNYLSIFGDNLNNNFIINEFNKIKESFKNLNGKYKFIYNLMYDFQEKLDIYIKLFQNKTLSDLNIFIQFLIKNLKFSLLIDSYIGKGRYKEAHFTISKFKENNIYEKKLLLEDIIIEKEKKLLNISKEKNINLTNFELDEKLYNYLIENDFENAKNLLSLGADINYNPGFYKKIEGRTLLLSKAILSENNKLIEFLIENNYDIDCLNAKNTFYSLGVNLPLHLTVLKGDIKLLSYLIEKGADINKCDVLYNCNNSINIIINENDSLSENNYNILNILINNGGNPNTINIQGLNSIFLAINKNDTKLLDYLLSNGGDINTKYFGEYGLLHFSLINNKIEIFKYLLEKGLNINNLDIFGKNCYDNAKSQNKNDFLEIIKQKKGDFSEKNTNNFSGKSLKNKIIFIFVILFIIGKIGNIFIVNITDYHNDEGIKYLSNNQYELAIKSFDKALSFKRSDVFYYNKCTALHNSGDFFKAIEVCKKGFIKSDKNSVVYEKILKTLGESEKNILLSLLLDKDKESYSKEKALYSNYINKDFLILTDSMDLYKKGEIISAENNLYQKGGDRLIGSDFEILFLTIIMTIEKINLKDIKIDEVNKITEKYDHLNIIKFFKYTYVLKSGTKVDQIKYKIKLKKYYSDIELDNILESLKKEKEIVSIINKYLSY